MLIEYLNIKSSLPQHYVDNEKKYVVAFVSSEHAHEWKENFEKIYPNYKIFVVWSKRFMTEIIFLIDHDFDPFVGTNTLSDMAIAHIQKYHKPVLTHYPVEINDNVYLHIIFKDDLSSALLPFSYEVYGAFYSKFYKVFNREGYVVFGPESNKVNAERHRFLDENHLWPDY